MKPASLCDIVDCVTGGNISITAPCLPKAYLPRKPATRFVALSIRPYLYLDMLYSIDASPLLEEVLHIAVGGEPIGRSGIVDGGLGGRCGQGRVVLGDGRDVRSDVGSEFPSPFWVSGIACKVGSFCGCVVSGRMEKVGPALGMLTSLCPPKTPDDNQQQRR